MKPGLHKAVHVGRHLTETFYFVNCRGMSKEEIKTEINKVLDHLPDQALEELLVFLKSLDKNTRYSILNDNEFQKILTEESDLLKRLAQ